MGRFHVWTLAWIIILLWSFAPIVDTDKTEIRTAPRHRHHRNRKLPGHHQSPVKNAFSEKHARKIDMAKILGTAPWLPTETSTSLLLSNSTYPDNEITTSFSNSSTIIQKSTEINLFSSTEMPSTVHENFSGSNDTSGLAKDINNSRTTSTKNTFDNSPDITTEIIVDDAVHPNDLSLQPRQEETTTIGAGYSESADTLREVDIVPEILMEPSPVAELVPRVKTSISGEQVEAIDKRSREPTLLNFDGPSIANDVDDVLDRESSASLHKRVKRDGSEDDNYLQKLEDSFPLSALEVEARESRDSENHQGTSLESKSGVDSFPRLLRPKRDAEDDKNRSYDIEVHPADQKKMSSADVLEDNNSVSAEKIDEDDNRRKVSGRDLLSGKPDRGNAIIGIFKSADTSSEGVEQFPMTILDREHSGNSWQSIDSSTGPVPAEPEAVDSKTDTTHVDSSSQRLDPNNHTVKNDEPTTGYRFEKMENEGNTSSPSSGRREINDLNGEIYEKIRQPEVISVSVDCSSKDDNKSFRCGLADVDTEIAEDTASPSSIDRLESPKRFGDRSSVAEEDSYASQVGNSIAAVDPYAEDNRIIDSILSKVDYRSGYQPKRSAMTENEARLGEEEMSSPTGERTSVRFMRGVSLKGARMKGLGGRHGTNKRKKSRQGREKKHQHPKLERSRIKRQSDDSFEGGTNLEWKEKLHPGDENFYGWRREAIGQEVISPHDGRRRRMSEEDDDETVHPIANESAGRSRRAIGDPGVVERNSEGHRDEEASGHVEGRSKLNAKARNREKRADGLQELKDFQNIRETDGGQNRSEEIDDKRRLSADAVKAIRGIEQIVGELVVKVNELHGYVGEVGTDDGTKESQGSGTTSSAVDRTSTEESKFVDHVSPNGSSPRPAEVNVERQPETCRTNSAALSRQSGPAKSNGRSARNLRTQRCSKKARRKRMSHRKWDRWTDWSSCSVTCGRGRQIRWRHCIRNCSIAETEMEEKACQLPACAPGKFLGIFG